MDAEWPLIAVRFALYVTLSALFGLSAFSLYALKAEERRVALALRPWLVEIGLLSLLLSGIALVLLAAAMAGAPAWPINWDAIGMFLTESAIGTAWEARMVALVVAVIVALVAAGRTAPLGMVTLAAGIALATLAWTGHGAMEEGATGWVHLLADILHLLAAGAWVGALLALTLLVVRPAIRIDVAHVRLTHRTLHRFALVGTVLVGTIIVTGLVNGWLLVGAANLPSLTITLYGELLLAKLALFGAMLGLASLNRWRLTPELERSLAASNSQAALDTLRRSLAIEASCAVTVLALVAWLGMLEPPATAM